MSGHLPECPVPAMEAVHPLHPEDAEANCMCPALRACEQRVLDKAREAVGALPVFEKPYPWCGDVQHCGGDDVVELNAVIAAFDALRGER